MISSGWSRVEWIDMRARTSPSNIPAPPSRVSLSERGCARRTSLGIVPRETPAEIPFMLGIAELIKVYAPRRPARNGLDSATPPRTRRSATEKNASASAGIGPKRSRTSVRSASMSLGSVIAVNRR